MANSNSKAESSLKGYDAAIMWFYENRPHMVEYIGAMGTPRSSDQCPRAMVVADRNMKPVLYANDEFLQEIGAEQAAGVLVHEWQHVLRDHFSEIRNPRPEWKYPAVVTDAHEATINDQLEMAGYSLPDDCVRGDNRGGKFYGYWNTQEAYGPMEEWYLSQMQKPQENEEGSEEDQQDGQSGDQNSEDQNSEGNEDSNQSDSGDSDNDSGNGESQSDSEGGGGSSSNGSSSGGDSAEGDSSEGSGDSSGTSDGTPGENSSQSGGGSNGSADGQDDSQDTEDENPEGCASNKYIEGEDGSLRPMTDEEADQFADAIKDVLKDVLNKVSMPDDEKPSEEALDSMDQEIAEAIDPSRKAAYSKGAGTEADAAEKVLAGGKLQLGWLKILQTINPEVGKNDGGVNARASYNWARPRRNTALIPGVILPSPGDARGVGVGATSRPTAIFPLDHSASIDRRLANALRDMAQSIPEDLIDARCYTFSTEIIPFFPKSETNNVASGGTNFACIHQEALKIQEETGEYPYVVCLTDGEAWFDEQYGYGYGYGGYNNYTNSNSSVAPSQEILDTRWIWVDVLTEDNKRAFLAKGYPQVLRQKNLLALPYDRSKL